MELTKASNQWATRPNDQRFSDLRSLHAHCIKGRDSARTARVSLEDLRVVAQDGDLNLNGRTDTRASLTYWSFGQLCQRVNVPASYVRGLPADLACTNINHGLLTSEKAEPSQLYFHAHANGLELQAITSNKYSRIWNSDVTARLLRLTEENPKWQPAPAAFDGSRGLYASDHDLFCFLVDNGRRIFEKDPNGGLSRGFFVWNSEVGAASFGIMTFLYEFVCGNHIVWNTSDVQELRIRHIGRTVNERAFVELAGELRKYSDASITEDEERIERARRAVLGTDKEKVLDRVFGLRIPNLSRAQISQGYDKAEEHADWYGDPKSVWGLANGLTETARDIPHADDRVTLERSASKILQIAF